jgi:hypothetical protein
MPNILQGLTDSPNQQYPITLVDGTVATLVLQFWPQQGGWFYDLTWNGRTPAWQSLGNQLVSSPNILRQYRNNIPFGITVSTIDGLDPSGQEDFVDGTCTLLLLSSAEAAVIESTYFPGLG